MPAPHHSIFYRPDALPAANQQRQSTEGSTGGVIYIFSIPWAPTVITAIKILPSTAPRIT